MSQSDPLRAPGKTPPRAEPLQPDRPGSAESTDGKGGHDTSERLDERIEQSKTALDNVKNP